MSCHNLKALFLCDSSLHWFCLTRTMHHLQINLIAPPLYVVTTQTLERIEGVAKLNAAIEKIKCTIEEAGGSFNVKMAVSV